MSTTYSFIQHTLTGEIYASRKIDGVVTLAGPITNKANVTYAYLIDAGRTYSKSFATVNTAGLGLEDSSHVDLTYAVLKKYWTKIPTKWAKWYVTLVTPTDAQAVVVIPVKGTVVTASRYVAGAWTAAFANADTMAEMLVAIKAWIDLQNPAVTVNVYSVRGQLIATYTTA